MGGMALLRFVVVMGGGGGGGGGEAACWNCVGEGGRTG